MLVGTLELELLLYECTSLKDKRNILKSMLAKIKQSYNVSAAEVDLQDHLDIAKIGFSCVSNSRKHVDSILNGIVGFVDRDHRLEIVEQTVEIY